MLKLPNTKRLEDIHEVLLFNKARLSHFNPLTGETTFSKREDALKGKLMTADAEYMDVDGAEIELKVPGGSRITRLWRITRTMRGRAGSWPWSCTGRTG